MKTYDKEKHCKTRNDTTLVQLTKPQLDTMYKMSSRMFHFENENVSGDSIPMPLFGDAEKARVVLDLKFRSGSYSRWVKERNDKDFQLLYNYLLAKKNSR